MIKNKASRLLIPTVLLIFILAVLGIYLGIANFYSDKFCLGTWINGLYCTGKSVNEVNELLKESREYSGIKILSASAEEMYISSEDISFTYDYSDKLDSLFRNQNKWDWPKQIFAKNNIEISPDILIDESKLDSVIDKYELVKVDINPDVSIELNEFGYQLKDTTKAIPDKEKIRTSIKTSILESEDELVLNSEFFYDGNYSAEQKLTLDLFNDYKKQFDFQISYTMGTDTEIIDEPVLNSFLLRDDSGNPIRCDEIDENMDPELIGKGKVFAWDFSAADAWVDSLGDKYNSVGKEREFHTSSGKLITVSGGIYGNELDLKAEKLFLRQALVEGTTVTHEPEYLQKAYAQGVNDIGDTYVEVNMTDQMLYYYVDGRCLIETPVVTGNMARRCDTPDGVNCVYFMQRNRTLIGPNYQTFVKYWIAVKGHIGIHDASWRDEYGGDIYLTNGSHGCINTPEEKVSQLYDMIEIGTPVVMFYME